MHYASKFKQMLNDINQMPQQYYYTVAPWACAYDYKSRTRDFIEFLANDTENALRAYKANSLLRFQIDFFNRILISYNKLAKLFNVYFKFRKIAFRIKMYHFDIMLQSPYNIHNIVNRFYNVKSTIKYYVYYRANSKFKRYWINWNFNF